jgi:hypothetical protein
VCAGGEPGRRLVDLDQFALEFLERGGLALALERLRADFGRVLTGCRDLTDAVGFKSHFRPPTYLPTGERLVATDRACPGRRRTWRESRSRS